MVGVRRAVRWLLRGRSDGFRARIRGRLCCGRRPVTAPEPTEEEPPQRPGLHRVCAEDALADGEIAEFVVGGRPVALARVDGTYHAIGNTCPHAGGPLGDGILEGTQVACPWHGWVFDVTDGVCALDPTQRVPVYKVEIHDGAVWMALDEAGENPLNG